MFTWMLSDSCSWREDGMTHLLEVELRPTYRWRVYVQSVRKFQVGPAKSIHINLQSKNA